MTKKILIWLCVLIWLVSALVPFFIAEKDDSISETLGLSFKFISAVSSIITVFIAISLFNKYVLSTKFIEQKTNKILELVDYLKGQTFPVKAGYKTYFVRPSPQFLDLLEDSSETFEQEKDKTMLIDKDEYIKLINPILEIKRSYWLPEEIKSKIKFLEIYGYSESADTDTSNFAQLNLNGVEATHIVLPEDFTFSKFVSGLKVLIEEIEAWLEKHSGMKLDLKMEEPLKYIKKEK